MAPISMTSLVGRMPPQTSEAPRLPPSPPGGSIARQSRPTR